VKKGPLVQRTALGWPGHADERTATQLGWPTNAGDVDLSGDAEDPAHDQPVRNTTAVESSDVSRETTDEEDAVPGVRPSNASLRSGARPEVVDVPDVPRETSLAAEPETPASSTGEGEVGREGASVDEQLPTPARTRVLVVANQKGGVGKTTSAVNIASGLAQGGLRVLLVDLDPQGNASTALGIDHPSGTPGTYETLVEGRPMADVVTPSPESGSIDVVPATIDLAGAEIELVSMVARESRLRKSLHALLEARSAAGDRYDYVLIDCPPSLGLLTVNAMVAADELLIPIQAEYYALEGLGQLLSNIELIRAHLNPDLAVSTILLTMYDARTRLAAQVADEVRQHFGDLVLRTTIPRSVRISEAPSHGKTVVAYDPASAGALAYLEAVRELTRTDPNRADAHDDDQAGLTPTEGTSR